MMIRSSSTPILGSLLSSSSSSSSFSLTGSPSCNSISIIHNQLPPTHKHHSYHQPLSCTSSPISPSIDSQKKGLIRRVQSEGNLEDLAYTCYSKEDRFNHAADPTNSKRFSARQRCLTLETIPSFSLSKHTGLRQEEDDVESEIEDEDEEGEEVFCVLDSLSEDVKVKLDRVCSVAYGEEVGCKDMMYLAKGLGVDGGCRGGNNGGKSMGSGGNDGDNNNHDGVEEFYKNMVEQNPGNSLFLRNYAQFLYQVIN